MNYQEAVRQFIDQVRWLYEPEYGDFKRKLGLYLQRLEEAHPSLKSGRAKEVLGEIRNNVVFKPNGDIDIRKVLRGVARNPLSIRALVSTGRDFNRALRSLRDCRSFFLGDTSLVSAEV